MFLDPVYVFLTTPNEWLGLLILLFLEVILGIDNVLFIALLVQRVPKEKQEKTRVAGLALALVARIILLFFVAQLIHMTKPVFSIQGLPFSVKDLIFIAGGFFLMWKGTVEIHTRLENAARSKEDNSTVVLKLGKGIFWKTVVQIALIDMVFAIDSVVTAVGMTENMFVMILAVVLAMILMVFISRWIGAFMEKNPTLVMLALSFLLMIGFVLVLDGFGVEVHNGYLYSAIAFSLVVEFLNKRFRSNKEKRKK